MSSVEDVLQPDDQDADRHTTVSPDSRDETLSVGDSDMTTGTCAPSLELTGWWASGEL